jgi:hypothetical protein
MRQSGMEFLVSFETNKVDRRQGFAKKTGHSISDIIKQVRKEYPDACMFRVRHKKPVGSLDRSPYSESV